MQKNNFTKLSKFQKLIVNFITIAMIFFSLSCASFSQTTHLMMGTGGLSGTWYPLGGAMAEVMSKNGVNVTVNTSAGSLENVISTHTGENDLGMVNSAIAYYAYNGINNFKNDPPMTNIRGLICFSPVEMSFLVHEESNIFSLSDLKGYTVAVGAVGSGDEAAARECLDAVGITFEDVNAQYLGNADQPDAFKDGKIDVMSLIVASPTAAFLDVASVRKVRMLEITGEEQLAILKKYPHYEATQITSDQYEFIDGKVDTVGLITILVTTDNLEDDVAYKLVKHLCEAEEKLQKAHPSMSGFSLDSALKGLTIPLHPGAEKYYREVGLIN